MKYIKIIYFISLFLFLLVNSVRANNITFANQDFGAQNTNDHTRIVQFDISWENSWRDDENYDCPWVFLKYSIDGGITWHHGTLTTPAGYGSGTGLDVIVPSDKKGAYLRRTLLGEGSVDTDGIQFAWDYGTDLGADAAGDRLAAFATVRVMAMEMVYIPEGPFYLGDITSIYTYYPIGQTRDANGVQGLGNAAIRGLGQGQVQVRSNDVHALRILCQFNWGASTGPYDDCPTTTAYAGLLACCYNTAGLYGSVTGIWFHGDSGISIDQPTESNMNTNWPTGFRAFYYMRYEVSQSQYRDFLNTLTPTQAVNRYAGSADVSQTRFGIKADNGLYGCDLNNNNIFDENDDGESVPSCVNSANDSLAYNDWAVTRLVTEFEYEKAARGTNAPVYKESAGGYGGTKVTPSGLFYSRTSDEVATNNAADEAWICFEGSISGPIRCGAFATGTSIRRKACAGYYGNMELTGNIFEDTISVGTIKGRSYTAAHGDGELNSNGYANVTGWPGGENLPLEGSHKVYLGDRAIAMRGADWRTAREGGTITSENDRPLWLSSRHFASYTTLDYDYRGWGYSGKWVASHGLRGGRTAE